MLRLSVALAAVHQCAAAASLRGLAAVEAHSLRGQLRFEYPKDWALGNSLMVYWNARATALLKNESFKVVGEASGDEILASLSTHVGYGEPTEKQKELYAVLRSVPKVCFNCSYPHFDQYAPWRLIPSTVLQETGEIVKRLAAARPALPSGNFAVVHVRCDPDIMENHMEYGVLPHRFVTRRMPHDVSSVILVGNPQAMDEHSLCGRSTHDLQHHLEKTLHLKVELHNTGDRVSDWLLLSQAPVLFCAPSTFCLTAAMGNPNKVFMPVNFAHLVVSPPGSRLGTRDQLPRSGFHWVDTDYLPGKSLRALPWEKVRQYLRSDACDRKRFGCLPVESQRRRR